MKTIYTIPLFILLFSCSTQFYTIESKFLGNDTRRTLHKTILISNPPRNQDELTDIIINYNRHTISVEEIKEYNISLHFYKETRYLTRNYEEGEPYPTMSGEFIHFGQGQDIAHHPNAKLASLHNFRTLRGQNKIMLFIKGETIVNLNIYNLEGYYLK